MIRFSICFILSVWFYQVAQSQDKDIQEILAALKMQETAWNEGDLDKFMEVYWKSDSLIFVGGSSGVKYGWQTTLDNYKKNYPNKDAMGKLIFNIIQTQKLSADVVWLLGAWKLERKEDTPQGHFTLVWKKINGKWLIVSDHSS